MQAVHIFMKKFLPEEKKCATMRYHEKAMKETLFSELDRNLASLTESADEGKKTIGNTPELVA